MVGIDRIPRRAAATSKFGRPVGEMIALGGDGTAGCEHQKRVDARPRRTEIVFDSILLGGSSLCKAGRWQAEEVERTNDSLRQRAKDARTRSRPRWTACPCRVHTRALSPLLIAEILSLKLALQPSDGPS